MVKLRHALPRSTKSQEGHKAVQFIRTFLETTSIQGLSHLADDKKHPIEKIIWLALVMAATFGAISMSRSTWLRYQQNPTVISMERDRFNWNTSFPSATICPSFKFSERLVDEYVMSSSAPNKTELREFIESLAGATYKTFDEVKPYDLIPAEEYMSLLLKVQFEFEGSVSTSGTTGQNFEMERIITEMGICYAFNSKMAPYSNPEYWKQDNWSLLEGNATFFVHPLDGEVFTSVVNITSGFAFYLHGSNEVADVSTKGIESPDGYFLQVYLTALTLFSSQRVRELSIKQRKCRFNDESNLAHSPAYSYRLCLMECRINMCKQLCGCVPHFYRKLDVDKTCDVRGLHCLSKHADKIMALKKSCSCFPNCDEVNYFVEDLDSRSWFLGSNLQWGLKEYPRMRLKRDILFGFADVLVYVGGNAGLFLGCSVLSFIEIFYYFSLRLFWFTIKYSKRQAKDVLQ